MTGEQVCRPGEQFCVPGDTILYPRSMSMWPKKSSSCSSSSSVWPSSSYVSQEPCWCLGRCPVCLGSRSVSPRGIFLCQGTTIKNAGFSFFIIKKSLTAWMLSDCFLNVSIIHHPKMQHQSSAIRDILNAKRSGGCAALLRGA